MVERKGTGHPDTLSDGIAEAISRAYSRYTLDHFGHVAHHWVDKCMLIGGESRIAFGHGELIRPVKLIVVGKITREVGDQPIPVEDIATTVAREFFTQRLPGLDIDSGLTIDFELNSAVGAGRPTQWYRPVSVGDLTPVPAARANDAVICSAYAPLSKTEQAVLDIERHLNGATFKAAHPEIGSDIKVLATRVGRAVDIVACVPWIAGLTPTRAYYDEGKRWVTDEIKRLAGGSLTEHDISVRINTRDDQETVYLTSTGTALDTGDVGVVGRGNRINGLIAPNRVTSIEAPAGKNPVYHSGKIYAVLALELAQRLADKTGSECYLSIVTSTGNLLSAPDVVAAELAGTPPTDDAAAMAREIVSQVLSDVGRVSDQLVHGEDPLW
jgi:S-adenosylmethionine synthetase